ncbi:hypothetical protein BU17DRAFT_62286 [Hysterangium stoloniferum]|nr:hypothetical protein BU17DRAFT_62286 [Hysterangium stoloniferum]
MFLFPAIALATSLTAFALPFTGRAANDQFQQGIMTMSSDVGEINDFLPASEGTFADIMPESSNAAVLPDSAHQATVEAENIHTPPKNDPAEIVASVQELANAVSSLMTTAISKKAFIDSHYVGGTQYFTADLKAFFVNFMETVTDSLPLDSPLNDLRALKSSQSIWFDKTLDIAYGYFTTNSDTMEDNYSYLLYHDLE